MLIVYLARSSLCRYFGGQSREIATIELEKFADRLVASANAPAATPAFEFLHWMSFLDSREGEALRLPFIEDKEYHEIDSAKGIPIGTVQWRVFNAKKKLAPILRRRVNRDRHAWARCYEGVVSAPSRDRKEWWHP